MKNLKSILAVLVAASMMTPTIGCAQANTAPADQSKADTAVENESASSEDTALADSPEWVGKLEAAKDARSSSSGAQTSLRMPNFMQHPKTAFSSRWTGSTTAV